MGDGTLAPVGLGLSYHLRLAAGMLPLITKMSYKKYNAGNARQRWVVLSGGIPDTVRVRFRPSRHRHVRALRHRRLAAGLAAVVPASGPGLRRARPRCDRPGDRARAHVRDSRARPSPSGDLGPKGDLNDWLRLGPKGDAAVFQSVLEQALAASPTPWALLIQRLPSDLAPWDLDDYPGVRDLLCELGHQGPLSRDAHLRLLAERCGVMLAALQEAARELAQSVETEP